MRGRVDRLERHRRPYPAVRVELIETDGDGDTASQERAEAVAGPWRRGQPVRVVEVVRPQPKEASTW